MVALELITAKLDKLLLVTTNVTVEIADAKSATLGPHNAAKKIKDMLD